VVVAAGNNGRDDSMNTKGYGTISTPANSPYVITVGAMRDRSTVSRGDDLIASYSSKGPTLLDQIAKPDIVAPGNSIVSAMSLGSSLALQYPGNNVPVGYYRTNGGGNSSSVYMRLSGTSMAAPMVSGAAALLLQQQPSLTPDQVKAKLMRSATKNFPSTSIATDPLTGTTYTSTYDVFTVGAGYLDVWAALNDGTPVSGSSLSPKAVFNASTGATSLVFDSGSTWQDAVAWPTTVVWGTNVVLNSNCVVWGSAVVWGSNASDGFTVVWGTTVVWGSTVVWGTRDPGLEAVSIEGDR
jgi:serine protease AprX